MSVGNAGYGAVRRLTARGRPFIAHPDRIGRALDVGAGLAQLVEHGVEGRGRRAAQQHVTAGCRDGAQEGAGLDAVGHHAVPRSVQPLDALHDDAVGAGAVDARAHRD